MKHLTKQINKWKKNFFGKVEELKSQLLLEIQEIDFEEERGDLNEASINRRSMMQEKFRRKSHQETQEEMAISHQMARGGRP